MLDAREQQLAAARAGAVPAHAGGRGPSPYDLYIGFQDVAALWACESEHPDELVARCALQSIEMGVALLADAAREDRPAARRDARVEALADDLVEQAALLGRLLAGPFPPALLTPRPGASPGFRALRALRGRDARLVGRVTDALLLAGFPTPLGVEEELGALRAHLGLPARDLPEGPFLPYARWAQPERVRALVLRDPHSPEDRLFAAVHQMTECWLRVVLELFARAERAARAGGAWQVAAEPLERAAGVLDYLTRHIDLLHLMVVADYHPLRVSLRGASGAQSAAARVVTMSARHFLGPLERDLEARGLALLDVDRFPHQHAAEHRYVEALGQLERKLMAFYFGHFQLARKVLGTKALGSLGYEVRALAERFTKPVFPEVDDARYDHTMLTNLAHGSDAGRIIAEREAGLVEPAPRPGEGVDPVLARAVLDRYFEAIRAFDAEAWLALFDPHGSMEDPVGSRPHRGLAELRVFFQGVQRTFARLDVQPGPPDLRGARATVRWQARGTAYNGRAVRFEGTEMFDLAPDGRILAVRVVWDPAVLVGQLLARAPEA